MVPVCEEVSTVFIVTPQCLDIFPRTLKEKQSPESLYGKIAGFFSVICRPERFYEENSRPLNKIFEIKTGAIH